MQRVTIMTETAHASNSSADIAPKLPTHSNSAAVRTDATVAALAVLKPNAERTVTAGENPAEFDALAKIVAAFWQPQDVIEHLLMTDYINAQWELQRLRRLIPAAFSAGRPFAVSELEGYEEDRFAIARFQPGNIRKLWPGSRQRDTLPMSSMLTFYCGMRPPLKASTNVPAYWRCGETARGKNLSGGGLV